MRSGFKNTQGNRRETSYLTFRNKPPLNKDVYLIMVINAFFYFAKNKNIYIFYSCSHEAF